MTGEDRDRGDYYRGVSKLIQGRIKFATPAVSEAMPNFFSIAKIFHHYSMFPVHAVSTKGGISLADKLSPVVTETPAK
jgi:hypothetical protein